MTDRPLSAWAFAAASILREAGEDGIPYAELRDQFGRPPWTILAELKRHGFVVGEQHDTFFLVVDPASSEPVAPVPPSPGTADSPRPVATGSLGTGQLKIDAMRAA